MSEQKYFKSVKMGGFHKVEVLNYIEKLVDDYETVKNDLLKDISERDAVIADSKKTIEEQYHKIMQLSKEETQNQQNQEEKVNMEEFKNLKLSYEELKNRYNEKMGSNTAFDNVKASAQKILLEAKSRAEEIKNNSKKQHDQMIDAANNILNEADEKSKILIFEANEKAKSIISAAQKDANQITDNSSKKAMELVEIAKEKLATKIKRIEERDLESALAFTNARKKAEEIIEEAKLKANELVIDASESLRQADKKANSIIELAKAENTSKINSIKEKEDILSKEKKEFIIMVEQLKIKLNDIDFGTLKQRSNISSISNATMDYNHDEIQYSANKDKIRLSEAEVIERLKSSSTNHLTQGLIKPIKQKDDRYDEDDD